MYSVTSKSISGRASSGLNGTFVLRRRSTLLRYALRNNAEFDGGAIREVDDASASVRTAVGDAHYNLLAVALVGDAQQCAEGIGAVSARQTVVVQALSAACARASGTLE